MEEKSTFASLGRVGAIRKLHEESPFKTVGGEGVSCENGRMESVCRLMTEGIDFDLSYFPLTHLGYKAVVCVTAQLYARFAMPVSLRFHLGVSAKLDFERIRDFWKGACAAAKDYGYKNASIDLSASVNGLAIAASATGFVSELNAKRRPAPKSRDLLCLSGNLGGAFMGLKVLEREKQRMQASAAGTAADAQAGASASGTASTQAYGAGSQASGGQAMPGLEKYKLLVGDYLKPVLDTDIPRLFADSGFYPSQGVCVDKGLSDAVKRLGEMTGLGAKIYVDRIPFGGGLFDAAKEMDIDAVSTALNGGEDHRVLFTLPLQQFEKFRHDFQTWQVIGHLALPEAGTALVMPDGVELPLRAQGWKEEDAQ